MSYVRFFAMIVTSTVVMFILMYLNTYAWEHIFFSETRAYMAVLMGATMAFVMLSFMLRMYPNRTVNMAIFAGSVVVFALSLWLVRSQITVSGSSYMRAMIPHHSIAVMTSERAGIEDARVSKLADGIIAAQRREIAEMRYLIANVAGGNITDSVYEDQAAQPGSVEDALANTLIAELDPAPLSASEAGAVLKTEPVCTFNTSPETDPILWITADGAAAMKFNGVLLGLETENDPQPGSVALSTTGAAVTVRPLGDEADWRQDSELVFQLDQGLTVGYRGFYGCGTRN
ncbi:DUF305 domain-containing protein [Mesorhizobium sp. Z1-4]|uniref:DUF305 domain-containing protein n=1 Tax=Mesorhizobium sp. Z1-4 TaxID=2448478 RepID=UPI000FDC1B2F|nr:DUF305 domain-containing protein [Mesorhizobium sp. Z1-4]